MLTYEIIRVLDRLHILPEQIKKKYKKQISKEYRKLARSKYFDVKWYLEQNPEVEASGIDPIVHYLEQGWKEGKSPSSAFEVEKYLRCNLDVAQGNVNPLLHYECYGKKEGRKAPDELVVNIVFPENADEFECEYPKNLPQKVKKIAVFASFNAKSEVDNYVVYYLKELRKEVDAIIFVSDNPLIEKELDKIKNLVVYASCHRHQEYDFGSYKRGLDYAEASGLLQKADNLIFCNDSCFGPVYSFREMFKEMDARGVDFWGQTENEDFNIHIQSYFLSFNRKIISSGVLKEFLANIAINQSVSYYIMNFEVKLTPYLAKKGYSFDSYMGKFNGISIKKTFATNPTTFPLLMMQKRMPLLKTKLLKQDGFCLENAYELNSHLYSENKALADIVFAKKAKKCILKNLYNYCVNEFMWKLKKFGYHANL